MKLFVLINEPVRGNCQSLCQQRKVHRLREYIIITPSSSRCLHIIYWHSHHLLLGVLEALCDEVERLVLGDRVLGHTRLLGVETLQLGLACNMIRKVIHVQSSM